MGERPPRKPMAVGDVLERYLARSGLATRLKQAQIIPQWAALVGPQIAAVTEPESVAPDGTLFVRVATSPLDERAAADGAGDHGPHQCGARARPHPHDTLASFTVVEVYGEIEARRSEAQG